MRIWKRNAVVVTVILFVCVSLYLSWSYNKEEEEALKNDPNAVIDVRGNDESLPTLNPGAEANLNVEGPAEAGVVEKSGYFSEVRLTRQKARDSALTILREATSQDGADQAAKDNMAAQVELLAQNAMAEARIEGLVMAKGFAECVALLSETGIKIVVAAPEGGLLATDVAKIKDIVLQEVTLSAADITIVPAEV